MEQQMTGYPSIDKPWLKYYDSGVEKTVLTHESIYMRLARCNEGRLDLPALELRISSNDFKEGPIISYRTYIKRIKECARALAVLGVQKDEIVPMIIPNVPESRIFIYAVNYLGATAYPVSPMASVGILEGIINDNKAHVIVIFDAFWDKFKTILSFPSIKNIIHLKGVESMHVIKTYQKLTYHINGYLFKIFLETWGEKWMLIN